LSETAIGSLYRALFAQLKNDVWADRVYADVAPPDAQKPFVVFYLSGGGDVDGTVSGVHMRLLVSVVCVADDLLSAFSGGYRIRSLLDDAGSQDHNPRLAPTTWDILTISAGISIHQRYGVDGVPEFQHGFDFTIRMQTR